MNQNKLNGLLAEVEFRKYLSEIGYGNRVSPGGWIARREGPGEFGHKTAVFFPETIRPGFDYPAERVMPPPSHGLHTICATFHQLGISAFFCAPTVGTNGAAESIRWHGVQLGLPAEQPFQVFPECLSGFFHVRPRGFNFLRYATDTSIIPDSAVPEEFSKEHVRVAFQGKFFSEISDVDGIFWGEQFTYPIEIKEKTAAEDRRIGQFFGLDVGPFVKLAFYAAKRGNLHSLFVVREIDSATSRNLRDWWFITYETLAQFASWTPQAGGRNMLGGGSSVVKIPKSEFRRLTGEMLREL
jgi:hypothetical protein